MPDARQRRGYRGFLLLDQGHDRRLALLLFDSLDDVRDAQVALTPVGRDQTYALMSGPALGAVATAIVADGILAGSPAP